MSTAVFHLQAMSLAMPEMAGGAIHPNRMPFEGVLTRVGVPSDSAPAGSGGKRVLITAEAAERALPSLMGMAVNIVNSGKFDGHAPQSKVGFIHSATIVDTELRIKGHLWAADFPQESLRIHIESSQLGFSFEARDISTTDANADPLIITDLFFTGAAILMKDRAAFKTTRLAAMAAMKHEHESSDDMTPEDLKSTVTEVIAGALAPVTQQLADLAAAHTALGARVDGFGAHIEAQQAMVAKVEPAAASLEKTATTMEAAGIGTDPDHGQVAVMRRMAAQMRTDAAAGRLPANFMLPTGTPQPTQQVVAPKFEDSDAYKALQASVTSLTTQLAAAADKAAAADTKIADLKAAADLNKPAPDRKTLPPMIANLVAKAGIEMPEEGSMMSITKLNQVLASSGMTTDQRMHLKTGLAKAGLVNLNTTAQ